MPGRAAAPLRVGRDDASRSSRAPSICSHCTPASATAPSPASDRRPGPPAVPLEAVDLSRSTLGLAEVSGVPEYEGPDDAAGLDRS
jgi:hypothetical protein